MKEKIENKTKEYIEKILEKEEITENEFQFLKAELSQIKLDEEKIERNKELMNYLLKL